VRVLAVDDWAWRKQQRYGTMLMDLEGRRVVDLLPVRSAASFAEWLRHSQIISDMTLGVRSEKPWEASA
jgi:transposase